MSSLILLIPVSVVLLVGAGLAFVWAVDHGQFDDLDRHALDLMEGVDDAPVEEDQDR